MKQPAVYILTNKSNGVLYIGVTSKLAQRIWQHKHKLTGGFSKKYNTDKLVWYELHDSMYSAIAREKSLKSWKRIWKSRLIEQFNPDWIDLYNEII